MLYVVSGYPQAAVAPDGSLLVVWDELVSGRRQVRLVRRRLTTVAQREPGFETSTLSDASASATYPAIVVTPTHAVVAWTNRAGKRSTIAVRRVNY